jgi:nucleoside-diphosphate-sugar epimerase
VVHVTDVARAFLTAAEAPLADVHNQAINTGAEQLNHQVITLAEIAIATVPGATLEVRSEPDADQRTYKTDFSKFARIFPDFEFRWTPVQGAQELLRGFRDVGLTHELYTDPRFTRLRWLRHLLDDDLLDGDLRWTRQPAEVSA